MERAEGQPDRESEAVFGVPRAPSGTNDAETVSLGDSARRTEDDRSAMSTGIPDLGTNGVPRAGDGTDASSRPIERTRADRFRAFASWATIVLGGFAWGLMAFVQLALIAETESEVDYGLVMAITVLVGVIGMLVCAPLSLCLAIFTFSGVGLSRGAYIRAGLGAGLSIASCTASIWFVWIFIGSL